MKKEKLKLILYMLLTPIIILIMIVIAINTREKPKLTREENNQSHTRKGITRCNRSYSYYLILFQTKSVCFEKGMKF